MSGLGRSVHARRKSRVPLTVQSVAVSNKEAARRVPTLQIMSNARSPRLDRCVPCSPHRLPNLGALNISDVFYRVELKFDPSPDEHSLKRTVRQGTCSICIEPLLSGTGTTELNTSDDSESILVVFDKVGVVRLSCSHMFHVDCIMTWMSADGRHVCPLCKQFISVKDVNDMSDYYRMEKESMMQSESSSTQQPGRIRRFLDFLRRRK